MKRLRLTHVTELQSMTGLPPNSTHSPYHQHYFRSHYQHQHPPNPTSQPPWLSIFTPSAQTNPFSCRTSGKTLSWIFFIQLCSFLLLLFLLQVAVAPLLAIPVRVHIGQRKNQRSVFINYGQGGAGNGIPLDKALRLSIRIHIWILLSDTIVSSTNSIQIVRRQCCLGKNRF